MEKKKTVAITFDESIIKEIDDWRANQRPIPNFSAAVMFFLKAGLSAVKGEHVEQRKRTM